MPTTVGPKGQVVIEKTIRDRLGVRPGAIAIQTLAGDRVEIRFVPPAHTQSLFGVLGAHVSSKTAKQNWADVKRRAWEAAAREQEQAPPSGATTRAARRRKKRRA